MAFDGRAVHRPIGRTLSLDNWSGVAGIFGLVAAATSLTGSGFSKIGLGFLAGILGGSLAASALLRQTDIEVTSSVPLLVGGLLVGFGTRLGSGCTSGHRVCHASCLGSHRLMFKRVFSAIVCGLLFGAGLVASDMINPARVRAFLDIVGNWDPSQAFVMGGALIPSTPAYIVRNRWKTPLCDDQFHVPPRTKPDAALSPVPCFSGSAGDWSGSAPVLQLPRRRQVDGKEAPLWARCSRE